MLFSTVEIKPSIDNEWKISFSDLDGDRYNDGAPPSCMGFYHYPRRKGKEKAFNELKDKMIESHKKEIDRLTKSMNSLIDTDMP